MSEVAGFRKEPVQAADHIDGWRTVDDLRRAISGDSEAVASAEPRVEMADKNTAAYR